jgi:hypothetical protein
MSSYRKNIYPRKCLNCQFFKCAPPTTCFNKVRGKIPSEITPYYVYKSDGAAVDQFFAKSLLNTNFYEQLKHKISIVTEKLPRPEDYKWGYQFCNWNAKHTFSYKFEPNKYIQPHTLNAEELPPAKCYNSEQFFYLYQISNAISSPYLIPDNLNLDETDRYLIDAFFTYKTYENIYNAVEKAKEFHFRGQYFCWTLNIPKYFIDKKIKGPYSRQYNQKQILYIAYNAKQILGE